MKWRPALTAAVLCAVLSAAGPAWARPAAPFDGHTGPRGLLVTVLQKPVVLSDPAAVDALADYAKKARIRTIYIQVYRANRASFRTAESCGAEYRRLCLRLKEDPLERLIERCHRDGIQVYGWMNLLSLGANADAPLLQRYGPSILTKNRRPKRALKDYLIDGQYFLEPGDARVQDALVRLTGDLVRFYPALDGVLFDYVRYPDKDPDCGYTDSNIRQFKLQTGHSTVGPKSSSWAQWKRSRVTGLLTRLASEAHVQRATVAVAATGLMPYSRAHLEASQDWKGWIKSGLVNFVMPMCYADTIELFERYLTDLRATGIDLSKLRPAVGAYKFMSSPQEFRTQFQLCETVRPGETVVFHYGSLTENPLLSEVLKR
ncbi:MAG: family 10 glycosylhydrolase [Candidatus Omnitrophota bacterium]